MNPLKRIWLQSLLAFSVFLVTMTASGQPSQIETSYTVYKNAFGFLAVPADDFAVRSAFKNKVIGLWSFFSADTAGKPILKDTSVIWIKRSDALRKLAQADSLPGYKQLVVEKQRDIDILQARIATLQGVIGSCQAKDSASVALFREQLDVMKDQKKLYQDQLDGYEKLLRRERRKRRATAAAGILATGAMVYLYLTK